MPFDTESFLHGEVKSSFDTEYVPVPDGEYTATVGEKLKLRTQKNKETGETQYVLDVPWILDDPNGIVAKATGLTRNQAKQGIFLELDSKGVPIREKGHNIQFGKFLDAIGLNKPGGKFSSFPGKIARVKVTTSMSGGKQYSNIIDVANLSKKA